MAFAAKCLQWHPVSGVSTTLRSVNYFHPVKPVVQTGGPKRLLLVNNERGLVIGSKTLECSIEHYLLFGHLISQIFPFSQVFSLFLMR